VQFEGKKRKGSPIALGIRQGGFVTPEVGARSKKKKKAGRKGPLRRSQGEKVACVVENVKRGGKKSMTDNLSGSKNTAVLRHFCIGKNRQGRETFCREKIEKDPQSRDHSEKVCRCCEGTGLFRGQKEGEKKD